MRRGILLLLVSLSAAVCPAAQSVFDPQLNTWTVSNDWIRATFNLTGGIFATQSIRDLRTGDTWRAPAGRPSALIRLQAGSETYDAQRMYALVDQYQQATSVPGIRQFIVLEDLQKTAQF